MLQPKDCEVSKHPAVPLLKHIMMPLEQWISDPYVEDILMQRPDEVVIQGGGRTSFHEIPFDFITQQGLAYLAASLEGQNVGRSDPLLSSKLPGGMRLQAVLPPCVEDGTIALAIRRSKNYAPTIEVLGEGGIFSGTEKIRSGLSREDEALLALYYEASRAIDPDTRRNTWTAFFKATMKAAKTHVLCGKVGTGKTYGSMALANEIPLDERICTIQDANEWEALPHRNRVDMLYSKGGQGASSVTPNRACRSLAADGDEVAVPSGVARRRSLQLPARPALRPSRLDDLPRGKYQGRLPNAGPDGAAARGCPQRRASADRTVPEKPDRRSRPLPPAGRPLRSFRGLVRSGRTRTGRSVVKKGLLLASLLIIGTVWTVIASTVTMWGLGTLEAVWWPTWQWWGYFQTTMPTPAIQAVVDQWVELGGLAGTVFSAPLGYVTLSNLNLRFGRDAQSLYGDSSFATARQGRRSGLRYAFRPDPACLLLGRTKGLFGWLSRYVMLPGVEHVMLYAKTGAGKGISYVLSNCLNYGDSLVVLDLKHENEDVSAAHREESLGQKVFSFSPLSADDCTHCWNPVGHIHEGMPDYISRLQGKSFSFFPEVSDGKVKFWQDGARTAWLGIAVLLCETASDPNYQDDSAMQLNPGNIFRFFWREDGVWELTRLIDERRDNDWPYSQTCIDLLSDYVNGTDEVVSGIRKHVTSTMGIWFNPKIVAVTSRSDFDLSPTASGEDDDLCGCHAAGHREAGEPAADVLPPAFRGQHGQHAGEGPDHSAPCPRHDGRDHQPAADARHRRGGRFCPRVLAALFVHRPVQAPGRGKV